MTDTRWPIDALEPSNQSGFTWWKSSCHRVNRHSRSMAALFIKMPYNSIWMLRVGELTDIMDLTMFRL